MTTSTVSASERVQLAYRDIAEANRPEVWIELRAQEDALREAASVDRRLAAGEQLPLAGMTLAVKDNIDVAGMATTAGCPEFAYMPKADAISVGRCRAAGAIVLGKTNMDQFATGLVGTRSPHGAVRDAADPARIAGGSSSGSAVAVALGIADLALGTDTAGSGRVPAAFQGIVGIKPTRGLVSLRGVVPACRSFDCVSVFAASVPRAHAAAVVMAQPDSDDPQGRPWPTDAPLGRPPRPRIAVAGASVLQALSEQGRQALEGATAAWRAAGAEVVEVDVAPLLAAGQLLYGGAFVSERYAAVGLFVERHRDQVDPTVADIILRAGTIPAAEYVADQARLDRLRQAARVALNGCHALLLPTAASQPTIAEVARDPVGINNRLGAYTTFCNLLDMCAIALPAGAADGGNFGVSLLAPAFHDWQLADLAAFVADDVPGSDSGAAAPDVRAAEVTGALELLVVGAHMRDQPLNGELTGRGGRFLRTARTQATYRLYRLNTQPPKPGLVRVPRDGAAIEGEVWALPANAMASLLVDLPAPMALGPVALADRRSVTGFLCEPAALDGAQDITSHGGWREYLNALER